MTEGEMQHSTTACEHVSSIPDTGIQISWKSVRNPLLRAVLITVAVLLPGWCISEFVLTTPSDSESFRRDFRAHLGYEHIRIASSIYEGSGFANPFSYESGPTAWMPPVPAICLSAFLLLFSGNVAAVATTYFAIQVFCVGIASLPALVHLNRERFSVIAWCLFALMVGAYGSAVFQITHDHPLQMLLITLLFAHLCIDLNGRLGLGWSIFAGMIAGVTALTGPAIAAAWAMTFAVMHRRSPKRILLLAVVSAVTISPWITRNLVVFDRFIPIKSNAGFEAWQSLMVDDDGLLDMSTISVHPLVYPKPESLEFIRLGEMRYVAERGHAWKQQVIEDPRYWLDRVSRRAVAALCWYQPVNLHEYQRPIHLVVKRAWKILAFLCLLYVFVGGRPPLPAIRIAIALWVLSLVPYIMISYYERYAWPTLPMQLIVVCSVVKDLRTRIGGRGKSFFQEPLNCAQGNSMPHDRLQLGEGRHGRIGTQIQSASNSLKLHRRDASR